MAFHPAKTAGAALCAWVLLTCTSGIPEPRSTTQPASAFIEVDYPPPPARVEFLPAQPSGGAVWVKGEWLWAGRKWSWKRGSWMIPPERAAYARRALVRRANGQLYCAAGAWRDAQGNEVQATAAIAAGSPSSVVINREGDTEPTGADVISDAGPGSNRDGDAVQYTMSPSPRE